MPAHSDWPARCDMLDRCDMLEKPPDYRLAAKSTVEDSLQQSTIRCASSVS